MKRVLIVGIVVVLVMLLSSCGSAGAGDEGGEGGSGSSDFSVPGGTQATPNLLALVYYGDWFENGTYNTDVYMVSNVSIEDFVEEVGPYTVDNVDLIYFEMVDASDSIDLDTGVYNISPTEENPDPMTVTYVDFYADLVFSNSYEPTSIGYEASTYEGGDDVIDGGTITVSRQGGVYTFEFNLALEGGGAISGSYTGPVDYQEDFSGF